MKILAIGNSHIVPLQSYYKPDDWPGLDIDMVPLNACPASHSALVLGRGVLKFNPTYNMPDFTVKASNYDAIVIVGAFLGGDGLFRSMTVRTAFSPLPPALIESLGEENTVTGRDGKIYVRPMVLHGDDLDGRLVSEGALRTLFSSQIAMRTRILDLETLRSRYKRVIWFESPFPKRSVFATMWGRYADTSQCARVKALHDEAVEASGLSEMCELHRFPDEMTLDGPFLDPKYQKAPAPIDIHAGDEFGRWMLDRVK